MIILLDLHMQSCHAPAIVGGIVLTTYHLISHWSLDVLGDLGVSPSIFFSSLLIRLGLELWDP